MQGHGSKKVASQAQLELYGQVASDHDCTSTLEQNFLFCFSSFFPHLFFFVRDRAQGVLKAQGVMKTRPVNIATGSQPSAVPLRYECRTDLLCNQRKDIPYYCYKTIVTSALPERWFMGA